MPPNQPQMPQQNPYDFIMNNGQPQKKSLLPFGGGNSQKSRLLIVIGGFLALVIVAILVLSLLTRGPDNTQQLVSIVQQQNEIVRISGTAVKEARLPATQNLASSTIASVTSSQQQVTALVGKKAKLDAKTIAAKQDARTDKRLTEAAQNNQFDTVFNEIIQTQLVSYQQDLKTAYDATTNKRSKEVLQTAYQSVNVLIGAKTN